MKFKDIDFKQKLVVVLCGLTILFSVLSIVEAETDFTYKIPVSIELVKAGALTAKPATVESMTIDSNKENNFIISDNTHVVYLEDKVIVFYESDGVLYSFGVPYMSNKVSILWPFDDRKRVVNKVELKLSEYNITRSFDENISNNLENISIIYQGYVDNNFDQVEIENDSEPSPSAVLPPVPIITENADGSLTLSIDEVGWVFVSDAITINYESSLEPYKITIPKGSLQLRKAKDEHDTIYVSSTKLAFSQIDSDKDLQDNINNYLIGVSVEYPKIISPPSPY